MGNIVATDVKLRQLAKAGDPQHLHRKLQKPKYLKCINTPDSEGHTPLHLAVMGFNIPAIPLLLEKGADVKAVDYEFSRTPLHFGSASGQIRIVRLLVDARSELDVHDKTPQSLAPLHYTVLREHDDCAEFLLNNGANVNNRANDKTALHFACEKDFLKIALMLVKFGADIEAKDEKGNTPLHVTAYKCHETITLMLLEKKGNAEARSNDGRTPLHFAAACGHKEIARILIDHGANIEARADSGTHPLHWAVQKEHLHVVQYLIERGCEIDSKDEGYVTPLHLACELGNVDIAMLLIQNGASIEINRFDRKTPIDLCKDAEKKKILTEEFQSIQAKLNSESA